MYSIYSHFSSFSYSDLSQNDEPTPPIHPQITSIPIEIPSNQTLIHVPVILPLSFISASAVKIQSAYRRRLVRTQLDRIRSSAGEADRLDRLIRRQDTVDAIRRDPIERLRISEDLMAALLRLDGVPGFYAPVREMRRAISRRIVGLQEVLDAVADAPDLGEMEGIPASLEEIVWGIWEEEDGREEEHWRNFCWG